MAEKIQYDKTISAYGGSGSIIETKDNGSLKIRNYSTQQLLHYPAIENVGALQNELITNHGYQNLEAIVDMPHPEPQGNGHVVAENQQIRSEYFPTYFFCPNCRRLHRLQDWEQMWIDRFGGNENQFRNSFPACYHCSNRIGRTQRYHRQFLEQLRFVMASLDSGEIKDIPFEKMGGALPPGNVWDLRNLPDTDQELHYSTSTSSDGLYAVQIRFGGREGHRLSLAQIRNKYLIVGNHAYKVMLRNSNSIYYPQILSSIIIPDGQNQANDQLSMDEKEFLYITGNYAVNNIILGLDFLSYRYPNIRLPRVLCVYALRRLKEVSVLLSYSRVSNQPMRWWDVQQNQEVEGMNPVQKLPFGIQNRNGVRRLPGIQRYGEGLFFEVDVEHVDENERMTFVHSYCHLVMKELEFQCGYPLSSLKEKIYENINGGRYGFLIYTIAGSEGSFGGLVSLLPYDRRATEAPLQKMVAIASQRAEHCPSDPICRNEEGHCFACLDLPETSCRLWNKDLDRRIFLQYIPREAPQEEDNDDILD